MHAESKPFLYRLDVVGQCTKLSAEKHSTSLLTMIVTTYKHDPRDHVVQVTVSAAIKTTTAMRERQHFYGMLLSRVEDQLRSSICGLIDLAYAEAVRLAIEVSNAGSTRSFRKVLCLPKMVNVRLSRWLATLSFADRSE